MNKLRIVCSGDCDECAYELECANEFIEPVVLQREVEDEMCCCMKTVSGWNCKDYNEVDEYSIENMLDICDVTFTKVDEDEYIFKCKTPDGFELLEYVYMDCFADEDDAVNYCFEKIIARLQELESYCNAAMSRHFDDMADVVAEFLK